MKEYIVTLKNINYKESFCNEMLDSNSGGRGVPLRSCQISYENKFSPNIIFYLDEKEAEELKKDPRVLDVEESTNLIKHSIEAHEYEFIKKLDNPPNLYGIKKSEVSSLAITGSRYTKITGLPDGLDVDVVIMDTGHINPNHPEFSVNQNGSGGSRVNQINWYLYTSSPSNTYTYTASPPSTPYPDNHPSHVGGIATGNTQGWAKRSNIYSVDVNWFNGNTWVSPSAVVGFHSSKAVNNTYGNKNPTIVNMSFGFLSSAIPILAISSVSHRGILVNRPSGGFSAAQLINWGIVSDTQGNIVPHGFYNSAINAEISNMINNGIIVVASSGNNRYKIDVVGGVDYNNYYTYTDGNGMPRLNFYHRGGCPNMVDGVICVGALGSELSNGPAFQEFKAAFSNTGPRVDVYAPGENIISSLSNYSLDWGAISDPRNSSYYLGKTNGTSMSSPQVTGMIACRLQNNRTMTPNQARAFIVNNSTTSMGNTFGWYEDTRSLLDGPQKVAYYPGINVE